MQEKLTLDESFNCGYHASRLAILLDNEREFAFYLRRSSEIMSGFTPIEVRTFE